MQTPTPSDAGSVNLQPLIVTRVFHAPRSTVFEAWSTAEHLKRWFSPETFTVPHARVRRVVGGPFELCMRSPGGEEHWVRGEFLEIAPNERLVIAMRVTNGAGESLFGVRTEVELSDALGGTQMTVTQTYSLIDSSSASMVKGAPEGWRSTLDKLEREVIRMQGGAGSAELSQSACDASRSGAAPPSLVRSVAHAAFDLERTYDAPVARVWKALTDAEAKQRWFTGSPGQWALIERRMDVRVGGREILKGRWEGGVVSTFDAIYHDVIPNERLVYSYQMFLDERKISVSLATVQLVALSERTTLKVTEQGAFLDGYDDAGSRQRGTGFLLDALGESLRG